MRRTGYIVLQPDGNLEQIEGALLKLGRAGVLLEHNLGALHPDGVLRERGQVVYQGLEGVDGAAVVAAPTPGLPAGRCRAYR